MLVIVNRCTSCAPRGTVPKSWVSPSLNIFSAHASAETGARRHQRGRRSPDKPSAWIRLFRRRYVRPDVHCSRHGQSNNTLGPGPGQGNRVRRTVISPRTTRERPHRQGRCDDYGHRDGDEGGAGVANSDPPRTRSGRSRALTEAQFWRKPIERATRSATSSCT